MFDIQRRNIIVSPVKYWGRTEKYFQSARLKPGAFVNCRQHTQPGLGQGLFPQAAAFLSDALKMAYLVLVTEAAAVTFSHPMGMWG